MITHISAGEPPQYPMFAMMVKDLSHTQCQLEQDQIPQLNVLIESLRIAHDGPRPAAKSLLVDVSAAVEQQESSTSALHSHLGEAGR